MKILQLIYSLESGGAERFTVDLSNELSKNNEVLLCTIFDDAIPSKGFYIKSLYEAVQFVSLKSKKGTSFSALIKLISHVYRFKPNVIHVHLNTVNYIMILAIFYRKCKYIQTIHSLADKDVGTGLIKYIKKFYYKHGIITPITISPECKESFVNHLNINKVIQINNGCCFPEKTQNFSKVLEEVNGYKRNESDVVFIHVARFRKEKNHKLLIDVFNKFNQDGYGFILLIIGADFDTTNGEELKLNSSDRIHFLGEKLNVKDYLFCSDVFVLTSFWEGLPISVLEAISCGVFIISTYVGGIPAVVKDNQIGYLSKDFSEENYYNLLVQYFNRKDKIDKNKIVKYFLENFSIESCAKEYQKNF